ncbi:MAG: hypothetical protein JO314_08325, partial [Acidobacteria bacterium]|nr:hypothetical protein [Acidobacteriota bacterium]
MKARLTQVAAIAFVLILAVGVWIAVDLNRPYKVDIREFDPDKVATLDTAMWRSYYSRDRIKLFTQLSDLLESEFRFPLWRRQRVALYAAKAAFVFKDGKTRADYEKALPDLKNFYNEIRDISSTDFDVDEAARLELEWWIVHRQRQQHAPGDLSKALADSAAVVYGVSADSLKEYGDLRAAAMDIRDNT